MSCIYRINNHRIRDVLLALSKHWVFVQTMMNHKTLGYCTPLFSTKPNFNITLVVIQL